MVLAFFLFFKRKRKFAEDERRVAATLFCRCPRRGRLSFVARSFVWPAASPHCVSFSEEFHLFRFLTILTSV